jgi:hypothetical protein
VLLTGIMTCTLTVVSEWFGAPHQGQNNGIVRGVLCETDMHNRILLCALCSISLEWQRAAWHSTKSQERSSAD